jgi:UDP-N-acetylmuramoylalanine--D-glutamate ligase
LAEAAGVDERVIRTALSKFRGLAHRLEFVAEFAGRRFYDDSKSTTPAATAAALASVEGRIWLLVGGRSKGVDLSPLAAAIAARAAGAGLFGEVRDELIAPLRAFHPDFQAHAVEYLSEAFDWCWRQSRAGDAIVLSPAMASHDQFADFKARGEKFRRLVAELDTRTCAG